MNTFFSIHPCVRACVSHKKWVFLYVGTTCHNCIWVYKWPIYHYLIGNLDGTQERRNDRDKRNSQMEGDLLSLIFYFFLLRPFMSAVVKLTAPKLTALYLEFSCEIKKKNWSINGSGIIQSFFFLKKVLFNWILIITWSQLL